MQTFGEAIYARTLSKSRVPGQFGNIWQYHSRSDAHSKAACWAIMLDLLINCPLLHTHAQSRKVGFGINHVMRDFKVNRKKALDLVICTPGGDFETENLVTLAERCVVLSEEEKALLPSYVSMTKVDVGNVLVALEAKACMTAHGKACPRLYDELSSSHQTVHGDTDSAIAAGFVTINISDTFISPDRNKIGIQRASSLDISKHIQPQDGKKVLSKVLELPRRSATGSSGFDALGIVLVDCKNDGSLVTVEKTFRDGEGVDRSFTYRGMIERISHLYSSRFGHL